MKSANWLIGVLVALVAVQGVVSLHDHFLVQPAYAQDSVAGSYMIGMMAEQVSQQYPFVLIDTKEMTILVYEYNRSVGALEFRSARSYQYDRKVQDRDFARTVAASKYSPSVEDIKKLVMQTTGK